ncbi:MAG: hypothetical protein ACREJC_16375, partial [Tepidisphaeraceae bacterium]
MRPRIREKYGSALLLLGVLTLCVAARWPALINSNALHSDAAIVGLQGRHMLRGEFNSHLWGTPYQGSLEPFLCALGFLALGAKPIVVMWVALVGHMLATSFVFLTLNRRVGRWAAALLVMPLVFAPWAVNAAALFPPRQWAITLVLCAIWLLDGAADSRRPLLSVGLALFFGAVSVWVD